MSTPKKTKNPTPDAGVTLTLHEVREVIDQYVEERYAPEWTLWDSRVDAKDPSNNEPCLGYEVFLEERKRPRVKYATARILSILGKRFGRKVTSFALYPPDPDPRATMLERHRRGTRIGKVELRFGEPKA